MAFPNQFYIYDQTNQLHNDEPLVPFMRDELFGRKVGAGGTPIVHLWRQHRVFVLGLRDRRMPGSAQAMEWLGSMGYQPVVRNSGGAAVPLTKDVLNISIVLPSQGAHGQMKKDFHTMYELIQMVLNRWKIHVVIGEIRGSYCPGEYDLSINGRKFCGIAQRRQLKSSIVQAFVLTGDSVLDQTKLVQEFYMRAAMDQDQLEYPRIVPEVMTSVSEWMNLSDATNTTNPADSMNPIVTMSPKNTMNPMYLLHNELIKQLLILGGTMMELPKEYIPAESTTAAVALESLRLRYSE